jgi:hypothetical protein
MENQVQNLKLNVTNIKSYLINSNKELKSLKIQKKNLFTRLEKQKDIRVKESKLESKNLGIGAGFSRIMGAVTAPARSIFDKILDFLGLIVLGILVQKLPAIIAKIDEFFNSDFIKAIGNVFKTIGSGFKKLGELIDLLTPQKQKELDNELKLIGDEADSDLKLADQADRDIFELEKELNKRENNKQTPTPTMPMAPMAPGSMYPAPTPQVPTSTSKPQDPQKFSKGGTVQTTNGQKSQPAYAPRKSGQLKQSERGMSAGFEDFSLAVDSINQTAQRDEKNVIALAELSKNFREWSSLNQPTRTKGPGFGPQDQKDLQATRDQQYSGETYASGGYIGATGDTDGNQTGLDMNLPGGIGTPIYAPFDLIYRSKGTDGMPSVGLQGTADVLGPAGRGFGYYGAYYFRKNDKEYEVLMGHFKNLPYKGAKDGEIIPKGTLLGYQGASGRTIGSGNKPYPHISLHVNGVGFRASNNLLVDVANKLINSGPSTGKIKPAQVVQPPKGIKLESVSQDPISTGAGQLLKALQRPGGGGNRLLNRSSNSGNQSMFIYAVQPVETFVPFPYPVPTQQTTSSSPQKTKVPPIWRA